VKKLAPLAAAAVFAFAAPAAHGQTMIEGGGDLTYTTVNVGRWLGAGVFNPQRVGYGSNASILFGSRRARGFHYGAEIGFARLMNYRFIFQGESYESGINALRVQFQTRFWFDEGAWFGEGSAGMVHLDGSSGTGTVIDPILGVGVGKLWGISDQLSVVARGGATVIFDSESMIFSFRTAAGLSYALGS
jgi:hypothetical protein